MTVLAASAATLIRVVVNFIVVDSDGDIFLFVRGSAKSLLCKVDDE